MAKFPKLFGKKKNKDKNKGNKKDNKKKEKGNKPKSTKSFQSEDSDDSDGSNNESRSVQFDEMSNHITEFTPLSPGSKKKVWHTKNDLQHNRAEVQNEKAIERTREKVTEAVQKELGAFATSRKIDKRVQQIMKSKPEEIGEYLQMQGVSFTASSEEIEDKVRNMVKNKLITDRSRSSFSSGDALDRKVDAIMGLDREDILEYLDLEEDTEVVSPEWRKDEANNKPDLQSLSSDSSSMSSFGAEPTKPKSKPVVKEDDDDDADDDDADDDSEEDTPDSPKPKKSSKKSDDPKSSPKKSSKKKADDAKSPKKSPKKADMKSPTKSPKKSPMKSPMKSPKTPAKTPESESSGRLSFSKPLPSIPNEDSSSSDASSSNHSKMWFEQSPEKPKKKQVELEEVPSKESPETPKKKKVELEVPIKSPKTPKKKQVELEVPTKSPKTPKKKQVELEVPTKSPKSPKKKQVELEVPIKTKKGGSSDGSDDDDDSLPRKKPMRGLSTMKSVAFMSMEEALNREGVDPFLKNQILKVLEEKNLGIESLEEALDEANELYLNLKEKQRKFIAVHEELEALARNQQRNLEIMTRELEKPKAEECAGLDKECKEVEALRVALDEANERTCKIKSKDRKLVAVGEELESLCRRQQAQIERSEKEHFDRLKAKDVLNESLKEQLKAYKQNLQEKDNIISMLQKDKKSSSSTNEDSNDNTEIRDIHDELIENLKSKDELLDSLRDQLREAKKTNGEQSAEIQSLERQLRDAKKQGAQSPSEQQQQQQLSSSSPSDEAGKGESGGGGEKTIQMLRKKLEISEERHVRNDELLEKLEGQLDESAGKLRSTETKLETTQDELEEANARITELKQELQEAGADDHLDQKGKDFKAELTEARSKIRDLERKLFEKAHTKIDALESKVKELEKELEKTKMEGRSSEVFNTTIVAEETVDEKMERMKKKMEDQIEEAEEELVFARGRISALENQLNQGKEKGGAATATGSDDQKDAEIKELQEQVESLEKDLRYTVKDRDKQWNEKDQEIEKLKEQLANTQGAKDTEDPAKSSDLDAKEAKIKSLQDTLDKSKEEADASIQKLENTVSELQDQIMKQMDNTKEKEAPPSSEDNKDDEIAKLQQQVEQLEKDLRSTVKDRDKQWNEKDQEIEKLKEELQQASKLSREFAAHSGQEVDELKVKLGKETTRASVLQTELQSLQDNMKQKSKTVEFNEKELEENKATIRNLKTERKSLHDLVKQKASAVESNQKKVGENEALIQSLQTELESLQNLLSQKASAVESTQEELQENEAMVRSLKREIENQKTEGERLRTTPKLNTGDKAALQADLDITKEDLREARRSLKLEKKSNEKTKLQLLSMENDLENRMEELALMEKQTELCSLLQDQVDQLNRSLEKNRKTIESQTSQIDSLKEELEMRTAAISKGDLEEILEVAELNAELEKADIELKKEKAAHKKAKRRMTKLESDLQRHPEGSTSDLQQKLDHQVQITELLTEQLQTSKASIESKAGVIESMKQELSDKEEHMRSLEAALGKKRKRGSSNSQASDDPNSMQKRIRKQLEQEIYDLQRRLRKEQSMNKRSSKKIAQLEEELDDQLADWVALENEMDETKARMAEIESQLAKEQTQRRKLEEKTLQEKKLQEKKPKRTSRSKKSRSTSKSGEDFNLYLDGLTRKVREARNQLETAHGRLDEAVSRHRAPSDNPEAVYSA